MFEFDRVTSINTLHTAWQKISGGSSNSGIDGIDLKLYKSDLSRNLRTLQTALVSHNYRPYREKYFHAKNRVIGISCVEDKIVQTALALIIASSYTPSGNVHGFIKNRSPDSPEPEAKVGSSSDQPLPSKKTTLDSQPSASE